MEYELKTSGGRRGQRDGEQETARLAVQRWASGGDAQAAGEPSGASEAGAPGGDAPAVQAKSDGGAAARPPHDPVAVKARLGTGQPLDTGVRAQMETAFGRSFSGVRVHTGGDAAGLSDSMDARAFTVGRDVGFGAGEYQPQTIEGRALIAHELAHTLQQSQAAARGKSVPATESAELEAEADRAAGAAVNPLLEAARFSPGPRGGLRLQRCSKGSGKKGVARAGTTFSDVRDAIAKAPDEAAKKAALEEGIKGARSRANQLFSLGVEQDPIKSIHDRIAGETGITKSTAAGLGGNPFIGVSQDRVEAAYRAWYEGGGKGKEPWVLLAVWAKEGKEKPISGNIQAASAADAKAVWRSSYFWNNLGTDHYMAHAPSPTGEGENVPDWDPAANQAAFKGAIDRQVKAGRLPRDVSAEIDGALAATELGERSPGVKEFLVEPTPRFYVLSLMLIDAYYRENEEAVTADRRAASALAAATMVASCRSGSTSAERLGPAPEQEAVLSLSPDGERLAVAFLESPATARIEVWSLAQRRRAFSVAAPEGDIPAVMTFRASGELLVGLRLPSSRHTWHAFVRVDGAGGVVERCAASPPVQPGPRWGQPRGIASLVELSDGRVVTGGPDDSLAVWDADTCSVEWLKGDRCCVGESTVRVGAGPGAAFFTLGEVRWQDEEKGSLPLGPRRWTASPWKAEPAPPGSDSSSPWVALALASFAETQEPSSLAPDGSCGVHLRNGRAAVLYADGTERAPALPDGRVTALAAAPGCAVVAAAAGGSLYVCRRGECLSR